MIKHPYRDLANVKHNQEEKEIKIKIPLLCQFGRHKFPMNGYYKFHARDLGMTVKPPLSPPNLKGRRKPSIPYINEIYVRFCERCGEMDQDDIHRGIHPPRRILM